MIEYSKSRAKPSKHRVSRRRGQSMIGLLVVMLIGIGIYMMYLGQRKGANGETQPSVLKQSMNKGEDVNTTNNISQIQQAIEMYKIDNDGKAPASLDELKNSAYGKGYPAEMWVDSVSKQPLQYDAQSGRVSSPTGGLTGASGSANQNGADPNAATGGIDLSRVPGIETTNQ